MITVTVTQWPVTRGTRGSAPDGGRTVRANVGPRGNLSSTAETHPITQWWLQNRGGNGLDRRHREGRHSLDSLSGGHAAVEGPLSHYV